MRDLLLLKLARRRTALAERESREDRYFPESLTASLSEARPMTLFSKTLCGVYGVHGGGEEEKVKPGGSFTSERTASGWQHTYGQRKMTTRLLKEHDREI